MATARTRDEALRVLGVLDPAIREGIAPYLRFSSFESSDEIVARDEYLPEAILVVEGTVMISTTGTALSARGPLLVDDWAVDAQLRSSLGVFGASRVSVLRVGWQYRSVVFESVPVLKALSRETSSAVFGPDPPRPGYALAAAS